MRIKNASLYDLKKIQCLKIVLLYYSIIGMKIAILHSPQKNEEEKKSTYYVVHNGTANRFLL